jgi:hypothetical protein
MAQDIRILLVFMVTLILAYPVAATESISGGSEVQIEGPDSLAGIVTPAGTTLYATGEIQTAVDYAPVDSTIDLVAKTYYDNVNVWKSLNIVGQGSGQTIVDGQQIGRVFTIQPNTVVTLEGMTIRNGNTGFSDDGTQYRKDYSGGGVLNWGTLYVKNCEITENSASYGGGIANLGLDGSIATLSLDNSNIHGNYAKYAGGGVDNEAISDWSNSNPDSAASITIENSNIQDNFAGYFGGGIFSNSEHGIVTSMIEDSVISHNSAGTPDHYSYGGGVFNFAYAAGTAVMALKNCNIHHNAALADVDVNDFKVTGVGGGVLNYATNYQSVATMTVDNCNIHQNFADQYGGGIANLREDNSRATSILTVSNSNIMQNIAGVNGGGLFWSDLVSHVPPVLTNNKIKQNQPDDIYQAV